MMKRLMIALAVAVVCGVVAGAVLGPRMGASVGILAMVIGAIVAVLVRNQKDLNELQQGRVPEAVDRALGDADHDPNAGLGGGDPSATRAPPA
jgi:Flp pilus assembly protein TadB